MIFHRPTGTLIITPPKTANSSLRNMIVDGVNFYNVTGPSLWDASFCSTHSSGSMYRRVHGTPIKRRILLFREPVARVKSLYKHDLLSWDKDAPDFETWFSWHHRIGARWRTPQYHYEPKPYAYIRTEHLREDVNELFQLDLKPYQEAFARKSAFPDPEISPTILEWIKKYYAEDFDVYQRLHDNNGSVGSSESS